LKKIKAALVFFVLLCFLSAGIVGWVGMVAYYEGAPEVPAGVYVHSFNAWLVLPIFVLITAGLVSMFALGKQIDWSDWLGRVRRDGQPALAFWLSRVSEVCGGLSLTLSIYFIWPQVAASTSPSWNVQLSAGVWALLLGLLGTAVALSFFIVPHILTMLARKKAQAVQWRGGLK